VDGVASGQTAPKLTLVLVTAALFTDTLLYDMVVPFLPEHLRDLGVAEAQIGLVFGGYPVGLLLATPIAGLVADRWDRRRLLLLALLGVATSTVLYLFGRNVLELVAIRFLQGTAGAAVWAAGLALLADAFPAKRRGAAMGLAITGMSAGTLVGPPLGGILFYAGGFTLPFIVVAALISIIAILVFLLLGPVPVEVHRPALFDHLRDRRFRLVLGIAVAGSIVLSLLEPMLPLFLEDRLQAGPTARGLAFAAAVIAYAIGSPLAGAVADRSGRLLTMTFGLAAVVLILPTVALPDNWVAEIAALAGLGFALAFLLAPALPELADIADRVAESGYGLAYALFNISYAAGMMIGPLLGGFLTGQFGFLWALVTVSGGLAIYAVVLVVVQIMSRGSGPATSERPSPAEQSPT
jgi:MFS family permease